MTISPYSFGSAPPRHLMSSIVDLAAGPRPDALAVTCADVQLTWAELERRISQLTTVLIELGVQSGDRVGIYLHKSVETVVAMYGISRAGAGYVPIDALAPIATVANIIEDCGIEVMVSHEPRRAGLERLPDELGLRAVVGLDGALGPAKGPVATVSWGDVAGADTSPLVPVLEDDLAYVMYTSGSTGTPKGMIHTHRSAMSYVHNTIELFGLHDGDRVANIAPLHFDMSTLELLAGVSVGARLVIVPEPHLRFPASLTELLEAQQVTTIQTVPSLFQQMLTRGQLDQRDLSSVRWVVSGGEVFPPAALKQMASLFPDARFSNAYGPAEVNQCSYWHFSAADIDDEPLPIGYPAPNTELVILDENDQPVPDGEQGLLLARSANMMEGYWNRPDLNEAAFLYREAAGGRIEKWYRIGDIVSLDTSVGNGVLRFFGRRDNQIKIRGNRVELEGVEAAVASLEGIEQAIVGVRPGPDANDVLVARYLPVSGVAPDPKAWRNTLGKMLAPYAVPTEFEAVETFPQTPSGKADRRTVRADIAGGPA